VRNVYYKGTSYFRGSEAYLRFDCADCALVQTFIANNGLQRDPGPPAASRLDEYFVESEPGMPWWRAGWTAPLEVWRGSMVELRLDRSHGRVYIEVIR
jgi:hypothetical protein